jgi:hypothetical protein
MELTRKEKKPLSTVEEKVEKKDIIKAEKTGIEKTLTEKKLEIASLSNKVLEDPKNSKSFKNF